MLNLTFENTYETYRDDRYKLFFVEILTSKKMYEAWLCCDEYGIKKYMFGIERQLTTKDVFLKTVNNALEDYVQWYIEDYSED